MNFNICVAIQVKSSDLANNQILIQRVLKENPALIELRFDYIDDVNHLTVEFIKKLLKIIQPGAQAIFTMRDSTEGGQIKLNNRERIGILEKLITARPEYIDIEMNSDEVLLKQVIDLATDNSVNLIFSSHDFEKTPSYEIACAIVDTFIDKLRHTLKLDSKIIDQSIYKIIFTAQKYDDNLIPLKLCKAFSERKTKVICFCMEEKGIFSRISCVNAGSFLTYASFEDKTAPGQIHIKKMREFHEISFIRDR
jgi:3-dehydroquinate dehydratase-1